MKAIKIDGAYPDWGTKLLTDSLNEGWHIYDKTIINDRYIVYMLHQDPNLGKCSPSASTTSKYTV